MGYYSQVFLKTTTEGWLILKRLNDSIKDEESKPLNRAFVEKTKKGNYKITFEEVKWYEGCTQVDNFNKALREMEEQDAPYSFIRIGEDPDDVESKKNYSDDMPDDIETFEPLIDINDEETYDEVILDKT